MNEAQKQATLSAVRSVLISIGSILTAHGYVGEETVQLVIGIVMTLGPLLWGVYEGWSKEHKAAEREAVAVNAGISAAQASPSAMPQVQPADAPAVIAEFSTPKEGT